MKKNMLLVMLHAMLALTWFSYVVAAITSTDTNSEVFAGWGIGAVFAAVIQTALVVSALANAHGRKSSRIKRQRPVYTKEAIREKWAQ